MLKALSLHWRRFNKRGVAAIEFALLSPLMATLLCGLVDTTDAFIANRRVALAAQEIGEMVTQISILPNQSTTLTTTQLYDAQTAIFAILPATRSMANSQYGVTVSEISFAGYNDAAYTQSCTSLILCNYWKASLAWSKPMTTYGLQWKRPCGTVTQTTPTAKQIGATASGTTSTVPTASMTTAYASVLVVDVTYIFTPIFGKFITGPLTLQQSAYFNQRSIVSPYITYDTANATTDTAICTGYT